MHCEHVSRTKVEEEGILSWQNIGLTWKRGKNSITLPLWPVEAVVGSCSRPRPRTVEQTCSEALSFKNH